MEMVRLLVGHWESPAGSDLGAGSKMTHLDHLSGLCRPTREHWVAAGGEKGGSFEGLQLHWEDSLIVVGIGLAVQMPSSCPVVVAAAAVAVAAVGHTGAEKTRVTRLVDRKWHIVVVEWVGWDTDMTVGQLIFHSLAEVHLCRSSLLDRRGWQERWPGGSGKDRTVDVAEASCSPRGSGG